MPVSAWTAAFLVMLAVLAVATGLLAASSEGLVLSRAPKPVTPLRPGKPPAGSTGPAWVPATALLGVLLLVSQLRDGLQYAVMISAAAGIAGLVPGAVCGRACRAVLAAVLAAAAAAWLAFPGWVTSDVIAVFLVVSIVLQWEPAIPFSRPAAICLALAFGYDLVQVFLTGGMLRLGNSAAPGHPGSQRAQFRTVAEGGAPGKTKGGLPDPGGRPARCWLKTSGEAVCTR